MEWRVLKKDIQDDLFSRGLADPSIRLRALEKIEGLIREYFPEYIKEPAKFSETDKLVFKEMLTKKKGKNLNSAESSIINEIYYRTSPQQLASMSSIKYRMCVCPYCYSSYRLDEGLWSCQTLICPVCNNTIPNPVKEEEIMRKATRGLLVTGMLRDTIKIILLIGLLLLIVFAILT